MEVSVKYSRKPVEERDINSLYLEKNRKIESIKNKLNALLKDYPEEKAIRKMKAYIEEIL
jgi:outer membrane protein assembly factor BamD (BamD/ComL family)